MPTTSSSCKTSPPPPSSPTSQPPPLPRWHGRLLSSAALPVKEQGPSVKLVTSRSTSSIPAPSLVHRPNTAATVCKTANTTSTTAQSGAEESESKQQQSVRQDQKRPGGSERECEPRWSGAVPWDRPVPSYHGREFIYSCLKRFPEPGAKEICQLMDEMPGEAERLAPMLPRNLLERVAGKRGQEEGDGVMSDKAEHSKSILLRKHSRLSPFGELRRSISEPRRGRRRSVASLITLRGDKTHKAKQQKKTPDGGPVTLGFVVNKQTSDVDVTKRVTYGCIVNKDMNWDNLQKWGKWEMKENGRVVFVYGMMQYAEKLGDTLVFRINDVDESRRSRVFDENPNARGVDGSSKKESHSTEALGSGAIQHQLGLPLPLLPTPRAESLHFDPNSYEIRVDASSMTAKNGLRREPSPEKMSMVRSHSHPLLQGKKGSVSSVKAFAKKLRDRSRSPVKRATVGKETSHQSESPDHPAVAQTPFQRVLNFYRTKPQGSSPQGKPFDEINDFLHPADKKDEGSPQRRKSETLVAPLQVILGPNRELRPVTEPLHAHSKSVSITSTVLSDKDDGAPAVINSARAVAFSRPGTPKKRSSTATSHPESPVPAPNTALPPVPETPVPKTPRNSISSQRDQGPPAKSKGSPDKLFLYPPGTMPKRSSSPPKPPAVTVRNRAESFPKPPSFPASTEKVCSTQSSPGKDLRHPVVFDPKKRETDRLVDAVAKICGENTASTTAPVLETIVPAPGLQRPEHMKTRLPNNDGSPVCQRPRRFERLERHSKRDSHVTEQILSEYSDGITADEDPFVVTSPRKRDRDSLCQVSPIIVNAEQAPLAPSRPASIALLPIDRTSLDSMQVTVGATALHRPTTNGHNSTSDNVNRPNLDSSLPPSWKYAPFATERVPYLPSAHEQLGRAVNRSSLHSSQRSSRRSSMVDAGMEARLSRLEHQIEHSNMLLTNMLIGALSSSADLDHSAYMGDPGMSDAGNYAGTGQQRKGGAGYDFGRCQDEKKFQQPQFSGKGSDVPY